MAPFNGGEISPGPTVETDEEILDWVRKDGETALHPSCTARMGAEDDVASSTRSRWVWGVEGLRVVRRVGDAATSPTATSTRR